MSVAILDASAWREYRGKPANSGANETTHLAKIAIKAAHVQTRETYGVRRLWPELVAQGFETGRDRVTRLRQELGLRCKQKRKFKATTNSKHAYPVAPNLLEQTAASGRQRA